MAILNIFKKKDGEPAIEEKVAALSKSDISRKTKDPFVANRVLHTPHITEKASIMEEGNKYVFKISDRANKSEVKKAVEGLYKVDVVSVKIINVSGRNIMVGRRRGWKRGYKKAVVRIKEGQKIEIMPR